MEKRYQVFVSSTFKDLIPERQEIMKVLLEMDFIPVGMELFPASDQSQWELIQEVIDNCDYYIVIIGGRYGSIGYEGYSYTEMEYRYAIDKEIPTLGFVHSNRGSISADKTDPENAEKLEQFIDLVQKKVTKGWETPGELGSVVTRSLLTLKRHKPGIGWVRGDAAMDVGETNELRKEIQKLQKENDGLEHKLAEALGGRGDAPDDAARGDDELLIDFTWQFDDMSWGGKMYDKVKMQTSWDEIFSHLSPALPTTQGDIKIMLKKHLGAYASRNFDGKHLGVELEDDVFQTIKLQFVALGLITISEGYLWSLTPYGQKHMLDLRVIRRKGSSQESTNDIENENLE